MPETVLADDPWAIQGSTSSAAEVRRQLSGLLAGDGSPVSGRPGVLSGMGMSGSALTATMGAGSAVVTPVAGTQGSYVVTAGGNTTVTLAARDATNSRRDLAVLRVRDPETTGGSDRQGVLEIITGTPAGSPSTPATPSGTLPLAYATVPPSGTVVWTDLRQYAGVIGGVIPCTSSTRPAGSFLRAGQQIFETDSGKLLIWSGSAWVYTDPTWSATKTSGNTDYTSSTTFVPDPDLQITLPAGRYIVDASIMVDGDPASDIRMRLDCDNANARWWVQHFALSSTATSGGGPFGMGTQSGVASVELGFGVLAEGTATSLSGIFNVPSTAGRVTASFRKNSGAGSVRTLYGSFLRFRQG